MGLDPRLGRGGRAGLGLRLGRGRARLGPRLGRGKARLGPDSAAEGLGLAAARNFLAGPP